MKQTGHVRGAVNIFDESRPLWQWLLIFLVPLMLSNILQSAGQLVGSIFVGRMIGVDALAAISSFFPVIFLLFSFLIGLSSGSTVLIGQAYGARDMHKLKQITGTTLFMGLVLGIAALVVGLLATDRLLVLLGTPANILADAVAYSRLILIFCPVFFVYLIYTTIIRGTGDSQTPFYFLILTTVIGILVTPMLIRGWLGLPQLGVLSAAVSFIVSNAVSFVALLVYLRARKSPLAIDREILTDLRFDWAIAKNVIKIGVPTGLQVVMVSLAEIAVISFVNRYGSHATAAYGAVNQVVGYVQFPAISMGIAGSIFAAQCIGARREDKLRSVVHSTVALNYAIGALLIGLTYIFAWDIVGWFITDAQTLAIAHGLLMITLWSYLLFGNSAVLSGIMRASGAVLVPTLNGILAIWAVEVPVAYVLMRKIGLNGIWIGYPVAFVVVLSLQFMYYQFVWKKRTHRRLV
ncbi:MAG: MATE family efflux transporter [Candidatus Meridianibacter frigidus]|nr:MAG: MATE family efflux transporter [Candidatus Eremiobacteraeota bacterium]